MRALPFTPLLMAAVLGGCGGSFEGVGAPYTRDGRMVALSGGDGGARNACILCHGLEGQGDGQGTPALAGTDRGYLHKQLQDYALSLRPDPVMTPIAKRLRAQDREAVAAYFASLPHLAAPVAGPPPPAWLRASAVGSCADCHGAGGEGTGPGGPPLAGRSPAYLADQLHRWRRAERRNDPRGVMLTAAAALSPQEIAAIARWLGPTRLSPGPGAVAATVSGAGSASE